MTCIQAVYDHSSFFQVLSHFIDCVFDGTEKDKVISLLKSVMFNVWPHLHNHRSVDVHVRSQESAKPFTLYMLYFICEEGERD